MKRKIKPSWIAAGVLVLFVLGSILFSGRPVFAFSLYQVHEIRTLPDDPRLEDVRSYTRVAEIPWSNGRVRDDLAGQRQPLKLGWVYYDYGILSMPYWAQSGFGPVVYLEGAYGISFAQLSPSQIGMVEERGSGPIPRDYSFPWYLHIWGWLFPILLLLWLWLWRREDRKREAEHWGEELP